MNSLVPEFVPNLTEVTYTKYGVHWKTRNGLTVIDWCKSQTIAREELKSRQKEYPDTQPRMVYQRVAESTPQFMKDF